MDHNFTITSLVEEKNENCKQIIQEFLQEKMEIEVLETEILKAHRLGIFDPKNRKPRLMVVKVTEGLKERIIPNTIKLRGKTNAKGFPYFVNLQLPDALSAEKKAIQYEIKRVKDFNEALPPGHKKKQFLVKNKKLFIDNRLQEQIIVPPTPLDLFVGRQEQQKIDEIEMTISKPKSLHSSQFIGMASKVTTLNDVDRAYKKARQLYPSYDHIIMAYNTVEGNGYQDDGEHAAGIKLHAKILESKCLNIIIMVARNFGGTHLGPIRFNLMDSVADQAMKSLTQEHPEIILTSVEALEESRLRSQRLLNMLEEPIPGPSNRITQENSQQDSVNQRLMAISEENPESP